MYTASDLKKGLKIMFEGQPWIITDFDFSKPGKGQAIYNCKLRNMLNGSGKSCSFRSNDRFEKPDLAQKPLVYSYEDAGEYVFNDEDYNEIRVGKDVLGDKTYFLTDGLAPSSSARSSSATPASAATPPPARSPSPAPSRAATSCPSPSSSTRATSSASTPAPASTPTA